MIRTSSLGKRFGALTAVADLTIDVAEGEVVGLLGPNGAGKTTTIRMLAGLISASSGEAEVAGCRIGVDNDRLRHRVGLLCEVPGLYEHLTAAQNLSIYARLYGHPQPGRQVERYLHLLGLWERRDDLAGTFSKGMKQKLAIARALVHEPRVLFLDEPTSALDPKITRVVRQFLADLRAEGRTIVLCTHDLGEAERLCDRIAVLSGRLVALDEPAALRRRLFGRATTIRLAGPADGYREAIVALDFVQSVAASGGDLSIELDDPQSRNPIVVRRLVEAGAEIVSVGEREHSLEEVYLQLIGDEEEARQ